MNFRNKRQLLCKHIKEHGVLKVAFAGMCCMEALKQCTEGREIGGELLMLITYRLNDSTVWESEEWLKLERELAVAEKKRELAKTNLRIVDIASKRNKS